MPLPGCLRAHAESEGDVPAEADSSFWSSTRTLRSAAAGSSARCAPLTERLPSPSRTTSLSRHHARRHSERCQPRPRRYIRRSPQSGRHVSHGQPQAPARASSPSSSTSPSHNDSCRGKIQLQLRDAPRGVDLIEGHHDGIGPCVEQSLAHVLGGHRRVRRPARGREQLRKRREWSQGRRTRSCPFRIMSSPAPASNARAPSAARQAGPSSSCATILVEPHLASRPARGPRIAFVEGNDEPVCARGKEGFRRGWVGGAEHEQRHGGFARAIPRNVSKALCGSAASASPTSIMISSAPASSKRLAAAPCACEPGSSAGTDRQGTRRFASIGSHPIASWSPSAQAFGMAALVSGRWGPGM